MSLYHRCVKLPPNAVCWSCWIKGSPQSDIGERIDTKIAVILSDIVYLIKVYHKLVLFYCGKYTLWHCACLVSNGHGVSKSTFLGTILWFPEYRSDPSIEQNVSEPIRALHFSGSRVTPSRFPAKIYDWPIEGFDWCSGNPSLGIYFTIINLQN